MTKSLLMKWGIEQGLHATGAQTPYDSFQVYQQYQTGPISSRVTQDVLLMAGAQDHYVPAHQFPDQIATLTDVRSLTARLFTSYEQAQNHCQVGNFGLAFQTVIEWIGNTPGPATRDCRGNERSPTDVREIGRHAAFQFPDLKKSQETNDFETTLAPFYACPSTRLSRAVSTTSLVTVCKLLICKMRSTCINRRWMTRKFPAVMRTIVASAS